MENTKLPLKEVSIRELFAGSERLVFEIPIYQRNYAWEADEINALIQDAYDSFKKDEKTVYYIGTLVTFNKGDNVFEIIDGQQRLTTIRLILDVLEIQCSSRLTYRARKKADNTLKALRNLRDLEEKDRGIENGLKYARVGIDRIVNDGKRSDFKNYFLNQVHLIHYYVPKDIDLNHYFEIMNSRGEQLEKHEIIKAKLMEKLKNSEERESVNLIWECCSKMGMYVQQTFDDIACGEIFRKSIPEFLQQGPKDFENLHILLKNNVKINDVKVDDEKGNGENQQFLSINEILKNSSKYEKTGLPDDDKKQNSFQPIIDFPNFLLIVLKLMRMEEEDFKSTDFILDLPIFPKPFPLKVLDSGAKQFEIVKALMNDPTVDSIVCATDAGREGELIFRYIYQMAGCKKPVERLWISSLTYRAIKEGFDSLKPDSDYDNLYESARCRSEADWLIGMNGSRAYAIVNQMKRLSVGRVLSPTLSILVKRELERRNFVPEEYCEVVAVFDDYEGKLIHKEDSDDWSHFPINQKEALQKFVNCHSQKGRVSFVEFEEEIQPPQQLYDLTSLQRDANRLYGMSSKWTLDTAQSLYEKHKAITYPRTDSRYLSSDIKSTLTKRLESLQASELEAFASQAIKSKKELFGRFINTKGVSDHHAIIPTGEAKGMENWSDAEKKIYDLIARRFIGMFFPDRKILKQRIKTTIDGKVFLSLGECELEPGWSTVDLSRSSHVQQLPFVQKGDKVEVSRIRLRTDKTKPPAPHTEASLLAAMEHAGAIVPEDSIDDKETEFGIGTPATRAATIEKLIEKEMAVRKGRMLIPTEYGIALTNILPEFLQSPMMTGEWEAKLSRISKGEKSADKFMEGIRELTESVVKYALKQGNQNLILANSVGACPLCNNPVREYDKAYYCKNKYCGFRRIYKAVKGSHPYLNTGTMQELLINGVSVTDKGTFTLNKNMPPYIFFEYAPKPTPEYDKLLELFEEYGLEPVDKVAQGGGLWVAGGKYEDLLKDFVRDCKAIGCEFSFAENSKALHNHEGWYHRVRPEDLAAYKQLFSEVKDPVLALVEKSGFPFVDKRPKGCLWFIAGEKEGKKLAEQCGKLGTSFAFTPRGGNASDHRPAWYSK